MSALLVVVVGALSGAAVLAGVLTFAATRSLRSALAVLLEFLLAAGLLRSATVNNWTSIASVALIVSIRKVVARGISLRPRSERA